ncbi:MAG TPA: hypothetical protein VGB78_05375 [Thermoplasmata archaeon]
MTLKTAQTDENAQFKTVGLELYYAPPWAPTTWTRTEDFQIGGRLKLYWAGVR